jgi:hypothetical protein
LHLCIGCNETWSWIQMTTLSFDSCFWRVFHVTKAVLAGGDF